MSSKYSRRGTEERAKDVLRSIATIRTFVAGMSAADFKADLKTQSAVEYELLVISGACRAIRDAGASGNSDIETVYPQWHAVCGIGNVLRRQYGNVDLDIIWNTVAVAGDLTELEHGIANCFL